MADLLPHQLLLLIPSGFWTGHLQQNFQLALHNTHCTAKMKFYPRILDWSLQEIDIFVINWKSMCPPGTDFQLEAFGNLDFVLCIPRTYLIFVTGGVSGEKSYIDDDDDLSSGAGATLNKLAKLRLTHPEPSGYYSYFIFVTGTTGGACGEKFCHVEKFQIERKNCYLKW